MTNMVDQEIGENVENTENIVIADDADTSVQAAGEPASESVIEPAAKAGRNLRKERTGIVVSDKMNKTVVVKIEERVTHEKYSKIMKRSIKFKVHDENNECSVGDKVLIMETRPLSKDKHFRLVKILEKAK